MKNLLASLLLCLAASGASAAAATPGEVLIGSTLREARMDGLLVPAKKLSQYRGKPLLINVWASWCPPCRAEMGALQALHKRYGGRQFNVIGISTDDYRDRAEDAVRKTGITFSNYLDHDLELENMLGANRLPLTLLVDANGRVLQKIYGAQAWDGAEAIEFLGQIFRVKM